MKMKKLSFRLLAVFFLVFIIGISLCEAQDRAPKPSGKGFFGLFSGKKKAGGVRAPKSASRVQKEQDKKKKQQDLAWAKSVKESQKRTIQIQTPEVQSRMKQDKKDISAREKARMKKSSKAARSAGKKYNK
jgi:hypothetical protein